MHLYPSTYVEVRLVSVTRGTARIRYSAKTNNSRLLTSLALFPDSLFSFCFVVFSLLNPDLHISSLLTHLLVTCSIRKQAKLDWLVGWYLLFDQLPKAGHQNICIHITPAPRAEASEVPYVKILCSESIWLRWRSEIGSYSKCRADGL